VVLGGRCSSLEAIGRVVYATRQSAGELQVLNYRGALPDTGASTVAPIGPGPAEAVRMLRERLAGPARPARMAPAERPSTVAVAAS
jgi:hypothetical protein